jgi:hypothetical protein
MHIAYCVNGNKNTNLTESLLAYLLFVFTCFLELTYRIFLPQLGKNQVRMLTN